LAVISGGTMSIAAALVVPPGEIPSVFPGMPADGRFACGMNMLAAVVGGTIVITDPAEFTRDDPTCPPDFVPGPALDAALARLGLDPDNVDHVVITHRHADHVSGTIRSDGSLRFVNARHWIHRSDWESLGTLAHDGGATALRELHAAGLLMLIEEDTELAPGIDVIHTPGETAGHCSLRLESEGVVAHYLGDVFHHPCEIEHLDWAMPSADLPSLLDTRRRVLSRMVAEDAVGIFTHADFPAWGRPTVVGEGFRWVPLG
jgi:glyoxylase-like metal-dependent hydrolase (beta-lactamase superfamily II)